jgi:hypothetical protein
MPIEYITARNGDAFPCVRCDVCKKTIADVSDGNAIWSDQGTTVFAHKECSAAFDFHNGWPYWDELSAFFLHLSNNTKYTAAKQKRAKKMDEFFGASAPREVLTEG